MVKRLVIAFLVALALVAGLGRTMAAVSSPCSNLSPDNWFLYWWYECGGPSAGGGGSGAA